MIRLCLLGIGLFLGACASVERVALPKPTLLSGDLTTSQSSAKTRVDHSAWDRFLTAYVVPDTAGINRVNYGAVTPADRRNLSGYLASLEATDVTALNRDQQLAFWINLYNAVTVNVILEHYPVASIRDITDGFLSFGPWDRPVTTINGRDLTLNDIEHRIIRPAFQEPRIHYALNCAAAGCPNLMNRAWTASSLDRDLTEAETAYVNDPRGISVGPDGRLTLSKIYIWFQEDFGANESAVLDRLAKVAKPDLAAAIKARGRVARYAYDWSLNDTQRR